MKRQLKKLTLEMASKVIFNSAKTEVNSSCFFIGYQPKLPETAKKLRKF
ncbi:cyclic lactone autoinducer peptide [Lacrimispora sp. JR3]